jgi:pSer/pThr/pTyr-binding forkhead associated (FHA) protein
LPPGSIRNGPVKMSEDMILLKQAGDPPTAGIKLRRGTVGVGRAHDCDLVLSSLEVSRRHAEFSITDSTVTLRDLDSKNGTYVNGERIQTCNVLSGQELRFGGVSLWVAIIDLNGEKENADLETQSVDDAAGASSTAVEKLPLSAAEKRVFELLLE